MLGDMCNEKNKPSREVAGIRDWRASYNFEKSCEESGVAQG